MEKVDTLVVDKTGTLTEGKPRVVAVVPAARFDEARSWLGRRLERSSEHPLAAAIVAAAQRARCSAAGSSRFPVVDRARASRHGGWPGGGGQRQAAATSSASIRRDLEAAAEDLRRRGRDCDVRGGRWSRQPDFIAVADPIKETTPAALANCERTASAS